MARSMTRVNTKKVESAPAENLTKPEDSSASSIRNWYEQNKRNIENYAKGKESVTTLRDVTKSQTKNITAFNKDTIRTYMQNIGTNERNIRNLSWYLYYRSQVYARIVNLYANMFCFDARSVIPDFDIVKGVDANKMAKSYNETLTVLDTMGLQRELLNATMTCFIQDVFYGVVFYDETGLWIWSAPADYCRISGKFSTGDLSYMMDMTYFRSRQKLLEYMPDPFQSMWNAYDSTGEKWQPVPDEKSVCFKFRSEDLDVVLPPLAPCFTSFVNLIDLEDIQAIADRQEIYKLVYLELATLTGATDSDDWKISPDIVLEYFDRMISEALPDYTSAAVVPGKLETISFDNDKATDTSKVAKATETVLNTAGGAELLNGMTISGTTAFNAAQKANTEYAISSLLPQVEAWVNRFLSYQVSNPAKVKFFEISTFTKEEFKKGMLESAQYGLPTKLAYNTLNGFSEKDTLALNFLEENVLGLSTKLVPLQSSYTQNGESNGDGAPTKDDTTISDDGEKSRDKKDKSNG